MVLSLAFILAFIGASVALLIGIIIFSEVQDDMLQSFGDPVQVGVIADEVPLSKLGGFGGNFPTVGRGTATGNHMCDTCSSVSSYRAEDGLLDGSLITDIIINVGLYTGGSAYNIGLYEIIGSSATLVATTGVVNSGVGIQQWEFETPYQVQTGDNLAFGIVTPSGTGHLMKLKTFAQNLASPHFSNSHTQSITSTTFYPNLPTTASDGTTISGGQIYGFQLVQVTFTPIFESQVPPEFISASNIAYTVIGIIPVALFFFLFAIFGGRFGDQ